MPTYTFEDPITKQKVNVKALTPPTESEIETAFAKQGKIEGYAPVSILKPQDQKELKQEVEAKKETEQNQYKAPSALQLITNPTLTLAGMPEESTARMLAQGALLGKAQEAEAGIKSLLGDKSYKEEYEALKPTYEKAREETGGAGKALETAAGLVLPGGLGTKATLGAVTTAGKILRGAGTTAAQMGISGAEGETGQERLEGGLEEGIKGTLLGGGIPALGVAGRALAGTQAGQKVGKTLGQVLDWEPLKKAEKALSQSVMGGPLRQKYQEQVEDAYTQLGNMFEKGGGTTIATARKFKDIGTTGLKNLTEKQKGLYDKAYAPFKEGRQTAVDFTPTADAIKSMETKVGPETWKFLEKFEKNIRAGKYQNVDQGLALKAELNAAADKAGLRSTEQKLIGDIYKTAKQNIRTDLAGKLPEEAREGFIKNLDEADAFTAGTKKSGGVKEVLTDMASNNEADTVKSIGRLAKGIEEGKGGIDDLKTLEKELPPEDFETVRQGVLGRYFGIGAPKSGKAIHTQFNRMAPEMKEFLTKNRVTGADDLPALKEFSERVKDINTTLNPSASAAAIQDTQQGLNIQSAIGSGVEGLGKAAEGTAKFSAVPSLTSLGTGAATWGTSKLLANPQYLAKILPKSPEMQALLLNLSARSGTPEEKLARGMTEQEIRRLMGG